jgi:stage V sporulation protein G
MNITEVRVALRDDSDLRLKAFASITLDDAFVVRGIKIIEGQNGMFVAMPSRKRKDGDFQDVAHPITSEAREELERVVLAEYQRVLDAATTSPAASMEEAI